MSKLVTWTFSGLVIIFIAIFIFLDIAFSSACKNTIIKTSENNSNEYVAVLFERNCGATTGFSTQVSILNARQELSNEAGNVYSGDGYPTHNGLTWLSTKKLHIGGADPNAYNRVEKFKDISITYE